jgi:hypothetical protein
MSDDPFMGKVYVRGTRFEDYKLIGPNGRVPQDAQDAQDAADAAMACLTSGAPDAYERAVATLQAVSTGIVA